MFWSVSFACLIVVVVILKYLLPQKERCPQCQTVRQEEAPLCRECSWIFDVPGEVDDDYGDAEEYVDKDSP